jgi:2-polyprenyl-3-methyl-5-hydroxy-6-metoxy-1,4-benzoquinol methylase
VDKDYQEFQTKDYPLKSYEFSSHTLVNQIIEGVGQQILDIGCGFGAIEELADVKNNLFIGIDCIEPEKNQDKFKEFIIQDLEDGLPITKLGGKRFDYILLLDILEHLKNHTKVLQDVHQIADSDTKIIVSVPNIANIYVRFNLLLGRFEYADRGTLDRTHLRFFTMSSFRRWVRENHFVIEKEIYTNLPINEIIKMQRFGLFLKVINHILHFFTNIFSGLLAYQVILVVKKK